MSDIDAVTGLVSPCLLCGVVPSIDYLVDDGYWQDTVPSYLRAGVICLPCLVERVGTVAFEHVRLIYLTVGGTTRAFGGAGARIEALEKAKRGVGRALFYLRQIVGAVDGVMADWEHEKSVELVPTTIGQWAERAIIELAAPRGEEER